MGAISRKSSAAFFSICALAAPFLFAAQPATAEMTVQEIVLTTGIMDREPVDTVSTFVAGEGKAYVYARIRNTDGPEKLRFVWYLDRIERARVEMLIGTSVRWRTWSSSDVGVGNWRVDLVDQYGKILAQKLFTVGNIAPAASAAGSASDIAKGTR